MVLGAGEWKTLLTWQLKAEGWLSLGCCVEAAARPVLLGLGKACVQAWNRTAAKGTQLER